MRTAAAFLFVIGFVNCVVGIMLIPIASLTPVEKGMCGLLVGIWLIATSLVVKDWK